MSKTEGYKYRFSKTSSPVNPHIEGNVFFSETNYFGKVVKKNINILKLQGPCPLSNFIILISTYFAKE